MLSISSFLIELWSTEKSYTVSFKEISLCLSFVKSFKHFLSETHTNIHYLAL